MLKAADARPSAGTLTVVTPFTIKSATAVFLLTPSPVYMSLSITMPCLGARVVAGTDATGVTAMPLSMAKVNVTEGPFVPVPDGPDQGVAVTVCTPIDN